jgi:hypothetical protein
VSAEDEEGPEDRDPLVALFGPDDVEEEPARKGGLLGAVGQILAAVAVVLLLIALFIGGAVAYRWVFG